MIQVGLLTLEQKNSLVGKTYAPDSYFNPVETEDLEWVISQEEMNFCQNPEFLWVKNLPLIEFKPKQYDPIV